jgi:hypothetical protein
MGGGPSLSPAPPTHPARKRACSQSQRAIPSCQKHSKAMQPMQWHAALSPWPLTRREALTDGHRTRTTK